MRITQIVNVRPDGRRAKVSDDTVRAIYNYLKTHSYSEASKFFEIPKNNLYNMKSRFIKLGLMEDGKTILEQIKDLQTQDSDLKVDAVVTLLKQRVQELRDRATNIERVINELPALITA